MNSLLWFMNRCCWKRKTILPNKNLSRNKMLSQSSTFCTKLMKLSSDARTLYHWGSSAMSYSSSLFRFAHILICWKRTYHASLPQAIKSYRTVDFCSISDIRWSWPLLTLPIRQCIFVYNILGPRRLPNTVRQSCHSTICFLKAHISRSSDSFENRDAFLILKTSIARANNGHNSLIYRLGISAMGLLTSFFFQESFEIFCKFFLKRLQLVIEFKIRTLVANRVIY